jgi:hypothetical protein
MAKRNNNRKQGRKIQNVRVIDKDEGQDDLKVSSIMSQMSLSESQIRVVCGFQEPLSPQTGTTGIYALATLQSTDDWASFSAQFKEFRIRAIQFRVFDVQPNAAAVVNLWATFHTLGGTVGTDPGDIVDRPDARSVVPGTGYVELNWVAHGQPEMEFQPVSAAIPFGGIVYNYSPAATIVGTKYQVMIKYIVDFRARI